MTSSPSGSDAPGGPPGEPPALRASDADRQATVHVLQDAVARGLLTFDEGSDRMAAAFAARFTRELPPLTADLPRAVPPTARAPGWHSVATALADQLRAELTLLQTEGLRSVRTRRAVAVALALVVMLVTVASLIVHGFAVPDHPFHGDFGPRGGFAQR